jgi:hypothetical protein
MSATLEKVKVLARDGKVKISDHGYDELAADGLLATEIVDGIQDAVVVEDYPTFAKGPCVLVLQRVSGASVHVVWGIPAGALEPAVLVTAYRPDPRKWDIDFMRRRR